MLSDDGRIWERIEVLRIASELHRERFTVGASNEEDVQTTANVWFTWLVSPTRLRVKFGPVIDKVTGEIDSPRLEGSPMQLLNTQKVTGHLDVVDRGGEDLPDNPDETLDDVTLAVDNEGVVSLDSRNGGRDFTLTTVATGTAIFTATLGDKVFTEAIDVIHSEADRLEVAFDEPTDK